MMEKRLSLGPYLGLWFIITAVQLGLAGALFSSQLPLAGLAALIAVQFGKVIPTAWRLNDQGRPPDDAVLALVPVGNLGLFRRMFSTPTAAERDALRARWTGELTAMGALIGGLRAIGRVWYVAVPVAVVAAVVFNGIDHFVATRYQPIREMGSDDHGTWLQGLGILCLLLLGYTVIQFVKRKRASRASWFPSLFLLPSLLVLGGMAVAKGPDVDAVLVMALFANAWTLVWYCVGESLLAGVWVTAAGHYARDEKPSAGALFAPASRLLDIAGPHGAMVHAIQLGAQVIVPGIYYAIQFAFVDSSVILHPEKPALRSSTVLTRGIRRRLFKVFWLGFALSLTVWLGGAGLGELILNAEHYAGDNQTAGILSQVALSYFYLPPGASSLVLSSWVVAGAGATLVWAVTKASFTLLYLDRIRVKGGE